MQDFDINIDQEQLITSSKNQALASQRLEEIGKSKYAPKTYTKGFFNQDQEYDYAPQLNTPSKISQKPKSKQSQQIKKDRSHRRSKKSQITLQPLKQTQKTSVFKNYINTDTQQQPSQQIQEIKLQSKVEVEPQIQETRRKVQRRMQKSNKKQEKPFNQNQQEQHPIQIPKISSPILFNDDDEQIIQPPIKTTAIDHSPNQEHVDLNQTTQQIQIPLQRNQLNQVFLQSDSDGQPIPETIPMIVVGSDYFTYEPINTLKKQITEPLKRGNLLRLEMIRDKEWLNAFWPQFHLHFCSNSHYLLSAKKTSSKPSSTFIITANKVNYEQNSPYYLGKMKSNLLGDILNIFGPGLNPSNAHEKNQIPREVLATIVYNSNIFQMGRPRQFSVYIKKPQYRYYSDFPNVRIYDQEIPLHLLYESNKQKMDVYHNRKPVWLEQIGGYMLNFKGRVECASIKNFILEQKVNGSDLVVFGKVNQAKFNLDITSPISPFIAFAIALSSFDSRIMCE